MTVISHHVQPSAYAVEPCPVPWSGGRMPEAISDPATPFTAVCQAVVKETEDVKTFVLRPEDGRILSFRPGQYVTLFVDSAGEPISRCYSISSSPTKPLTFSITVKREPGGTGSGWVHDHLDVGGTVELSGPHGEFVLPEDRAEPKYLFLAAGVGMTPLMSMTRALHDSPSRSDVVVLQHAGEPSRFVFSSELAFLGSADPRIRVITSCGDRDPGWDWSGYRGRISAELITEVVPDLQERDVFVCGPASYLDRVRALLDELGVPRSQTHWESFVFADQEAVALTAEVDDADAGTEAVENDVPGTFAVTFTQSNKTVHIGPDERILTAARREGLRLPSSCGKGVCGTCKSLLVEGSVDMKHGGGIRKREIEQNKILICCSTPLEDLVIDA